MKTKKPNVSGYTFSNMFKGIEDEHKWVKVKGFYNREHAMKIYHQATSLNNLTRSK